MLAIHLKRNKSNCIVNKINPILSTGWGPSSLAKPVCSYTIVYDTQITIFRWGYRPTNRTGGPILYVSQAIDATAPRRLVHGGSWQATRREPKVAPDFQRSNMGGPREIPNFTHVHTVMALYQL